MILEKEAVSVEAKVLGEKIVQLRKAKGMTQKQLAEAVHVTDGAVSKWERGLNYPDLSILDSVARALDTNLIVLLSLEGSTNDQVAETLTQISAQEKQRLIREIRMRGYIKVAIGCMLWLSLLIASKIFDNHGIYGLAQVVTMGMLGFTGTIISFELYTLKNLPKLR